MTVRRLEPAVLIRVEADNLALEVDVAYLQPKDSIVQRSR